MFEYEPADIHPTTLVLHRWEWGISCGPGPGSSFLFLCNSAEDYVTILSSLGYCANDGPSGEAGYKYAMNCIHDFFENLKSLESDNGGTLPEDLINPLIAELNKHVCFSTHGVRISDAGIESKGTILNYLNDYEVFKKIRTLFKYYYESESGPDLARIKARLKRKKSFVLPGDAELIALVVNLYNEGELEFVDPDEKDSDDDKLLRT